MGPAVSVELTMSRVGWGLVRVSVSGVHCIAFGAVFPHGERSVLIHGYVPWY